MDPALSPSSNVMLFIPPLEGVFRLHARLRKEQGNPFPWWLGQTEQPVATIEAEHRPSPQEVRDIGTERHRQVMQPTRRHRGTPQPAEDAERCGPIAAAASQTGAR